MFPFEPSLLDNFPEAALLTRQGRVVYANPMARHYLPQLEADAPLPAGLDLPVSAPTGAGAFSVGSTTYSFRLTASEDGQTIFFCPAPQTALTDLQLEGALRQLRALLGEFAAELGPHTTEDAPALSPETRADFVKSYHRAFRLVNNLDYLRQAGGPEGAPFRSASLDLAGLCRQLVDSADALLAQAGTSVRFDSALTSLLIPGDSTLLQRLLLDLIANSARAAKGGAIVLHLRRQGNRALLSLSDSGGPLNQRQLCAMLQQDTDQAIPTPGQGAGLGLPIVRHIVALHQGSMLVEWDRSSPTLLISLPVGPLDTRATVETPRSDQSGGLSPLLVELSDVLPARLFSLEGLD